MKISYDVIYELSRRAKYKNISEDKNFCYFVFQGVRVEAVRDSSGYYMICCCKGGAAKKTNRTDTYNDKIFCIADSGTKVVYDQKNYDSFMSSILDYIKAHPNWF